MAPEQADSQVSALRLRRRHFLLQYFHFKEYEAEYWRGLSIPPVDNELADELLGSPLTSPY